MKFYKTMAVPVLSYGSETWVTKTKYDNLIQTSEMRFLRSVKGYTLEDRQRNEDIRKELNIFSLPGRIQENKRKWKEHVSRMSPDRITNQITQYRPRGRRDPGRPRKRWSEVGTGLRA